MMIQKQYKQQLLQCLAEKDRKFQGFQEFKKSLAVSKSLVGPNPGAKSVQNLSMNMSSQ